MFQSSDMLLYFALEKNVILNEQILSKIFKSYRLLKSILYLFDEYQILLWMALLLNNGR